jgi:hypothetical protein
MAFAQDAPVAKVSGYVNDGLKLVNNKDGTTYQAYANDFGAAGYVGKLTGSYTAANYGVTSTIDLKQAGGVVVDTSYAWVSPMAGLKIVAGSGNDNPLGELDDNGAGAFSTAGVAVEYTMGGLTVGAVAAPSTTAGKVANYVAGIRYALENVATVNATFGSLDPDALGWYRATFSVTAVPGLTLTGGYNVPQLNKVSAGSAAVAGSGVYSLDTATGKIVQATPAVAAVAASPAAFFDATLGYKISDALSAGVVVYDKNLNVGTSFITYKPNASFDLGGGLKVSAYLLGDTNSNANYEPQAELDYTLGGATIKTQVFYDTNPGNLASAKPATTVESDFIFSF